LLIVFNYISFLIAQEQRRDLPATLLAEWLERLANLSGKLPRRGNTHLRQRKNTSTAQRVRVAAECIRFGVELRFEVEPQLEVE
jgi:hypothetical protein